MRLRILALAALCAAFSSGAFGQVTAPMNFAEPSIPTSETISKEISEVRLVLTVADQRGHLIRGLGPADLAVFDDGRSIDKLTYFAAESELPLRIVVLVDASGSMANQFAFERRLTADFFKKSVRPGDSAQLIAFDTENFVMDPRGADTQIKKMQQERPNAGTAIYDAVRVACERLNRNPDERARKAMLLITDGDDNSSHTSLQQTIEAAWQGEVTIFIAILNHVDPSREMALLARETGGQVWSDMSTGGVLSAFKQVQQNLRSQYVLAYRMPDAQADGRFHPVKVVPANKKLRALCRRGYFALKRRLTKTDPGEM